MTLKSLQTQLPNKLEGSGDAGTFSDSVASRAAGVLSYGQTLSPPLLCFPILSTTRPLWFEDSKAWSAPPHIWSDFVWPHGLEPGRPFRLAHTAGSRHAGRPTWQWSRSPREDVSSLLWAQGPGSGTLSSPRFIYLSFVWGEIGENQIQWAVLAAVAGKKGMSVSPERIPCIVALAPRLGFDRQCPSFSLCPPARPRLPACLSAHGPWACRCPLDLAAGKEEKEMPWLLCPAWPTRSCRIWGRLGEGRAVTPL